MKLKDLKVGEEYAFAPPNSYDSKRPARVRVVQIGVYGNAPSNSSYRKSSAHPNFVEFETVEGSYVPSNFKVPLTDTGEIRHWRSDKPIDKMVYRGPTMNFLRLWSEHAEQAAQDEAASKRWQRRRAAERDIRLGVIQQFSDLGFLGMSDYNYDVRFTVEQAQEILKRIEAAK